MGEHAQDHVGGGWRGEPAARMAVQGAPAPGVRVRPKVTALQRLAGNTAVSRVLGRDVVVQRAAGDPPAVEGPVLGGTANTTRTVTLYHYGDLEGTTTFTSRQGYPRLTEYGLGTSQAEVAEFTGTPVRATLKYKYELVIDADYFAKNFGENGTRKGYSEFSYSSKEHGSAIETRFFRRTGTLTVSTGGGGGASPSGGQPPPDHEGGGGSGTSARAKATAAAVLVVLATNITFNWIIGRQNERDIKAALAAKEADLQTVQRTDPSQGILLSFRFTGGVDSGEGPTAAARFAGLSYDTGRSEDDARETWRRRIGGGPPGSTYQTFWIKPVSPVAVPPANWTSVAVATFADLSKIEFEHLRYAAIGGFSTGRSIGPVDFSGRGFAKDLSFVVLRAPDRIPFHWPGGRQSFEDVQVSDRTVAGGSAPALMADGDPVVAVEAANDVTYGLFHANGAEASMEVDDKAGALDVPNLAEVRWLDPGQVRVTRRL